MNIAVPSRFACLKIEDDEDRKKSQNNTKKPKQEDKKPLKSSVSSNSSVNSKKSSTSSKQNGVTNKKQKQKQQVKVQQWEEWKQRDDELVNNNFEEELQSAILQSKMDFQKQNRVIKLSSNAISSKKKKNKTMSLDEFKSMESGDGDNNSNGLKTENNEEELLEVMMKQVKEEVCRGKIEEQRKEREASIDEIITSAQFQQRLEKEKSTNERLRQELELVKKDMAAVKERNKTLCSILGHGEMKEKADVLLELERLGSVKNELTEEVSRLHTLLEQERSKVAGLLAEKHKDKKHKKSGH